MSSETDTATKPTSKPFVGQQEQVDIFSEYTNKAFPFEAFPSLFKNLATTQLKGRNVPLEFTCFNALGIIAGVAGYHYKLLNAVKNHTQYANLYLIGSGTSSTGKSIALEPLLKHLMLEHNSRFKQHEASLKDKSKADSVSPIFMFANATAEAIRNKMHETNAPMFSPSSEAGDSLDIIGGIYKQGGKNEIDFYNKAWDTAPFNCLRATGSVQNIVIDKACLGLLWLTQPHKIMDCLIKDSKARNSGFMARPLFFQADNKLQEETDEEVEINQVYFDEWDTLIDAILVSRDTNTCKNIFAEEEAKIAFRTFHNEIIHALNGDLQSFEDILAKSREKACRVALNFAIAEGKFRIDKDMAERACDVIRYSNGILLKMYRTAYNEGIERLKNEVDTFLTQRQAQQLAVSKFAHDKGIEISELESLCKNYPLLYKIEKNPTGKGQIFIKNNQEKC